MWLYCSSVEQAHLQKDANRWHRRPFPLIWPINPNMSTEESHLQVLRLLQTNPRVNQRGLADALGISLGKTNYCLKALMSKGLIKVQNFRSSDNKLAYAYLLTPSGMAEKSKLTAKFLKRKLAEYESLQAEIEQLKTEIDNE
jgi:EPS-associated MarR family transcriptional regulator